MNEYFVQDGTYYNKSDKKLFSGKVRNIDFEEGFVKEGKKVGNWKYYANCSGKEGCYKFRECNYVDGKEDGYCIDYYETSQIRCKFFYKKGRLDGPYKSFHINGKLFEEGNYKNNKKIGSWVIIYNDGEDILSIKEGFYHFQDILDGHGQMIFIDGGEYNGEFKNKKFHGKGKYNFASGLIYEGQFLNNKFNGKGTLIFPNKKNYIGEFKNNKFCGFGTLLNENGSKYVGAFKDHQYHGKGTLTNHDGKIEKGFWKNGIKIS